MVVSRKQNETAILPTCQLSHSPAFTNSLLSRKLLHHPGKINNRAMHNIDFVVVRLNIKSGILLDISLKLYPPPPQYMFYKCTRHEIVTYSNLRQAHDLCSNTKSAIFFLCNESMFFLTKHTFSGIRRFMVLLHP